MLRPVIQWHLRNPPGNALYDPGIFTDVATTIAMKDQAGTRSHRTKAFDPEVVAIDSCVRFTTLAYWNGSVPKRIMPTYKRCRNGA
jgi:hypothetical protein